MKAEPKQSPAVLCEIPNPEAAALVRALHRAIAATGDKGNSLDVQRLTGLRDCLQGALDGCRCTVREVES